MNGIAATALALLIGAAQVPTKPAGPPPEPLLPGTAAVAGRVLDAAEKPLEGADVSLTLLPATGVAGLELADGILTLKPVAGFKPTLRSSKSLTDRNGAFVFPDIAAGTYFLVATHKEHLTEVTRREIEIVAGETRGDLTINMRAAGIIRGRLLDHEGQPLAGVGVSAWFDESGRMAGGARSEADGRFEIRTPQPASVVVAAEVVGRGGHGHVRIYYPGALNLEEAQTLAIGPGGAADLEFRVPEITSAAITAHLSGPDGYRLDELNLLRPDTNMRLPLNTHESVVSTINLRQGRYALEARATAADEPLAAFAIVDLQSVDIEVPLHLQPAGNVSGKIVLERGGLPPVDGVRVAAVWTDGGVEMKPSPDEVAVGPDGAFRFTGLFGHRDFRVIGLPDTWQVTAIRAGRSDITTSGLDVDPGSATEISIVVSRR